jgi:hypothetical protein
MFLAAIDHVIIRSADPHADLEHAATALNVPILRPVRNYGDFISGLIRIGNLDVEFLKIGTEPIIRPYLYGIAFESCLDVWKTMTWLQQIGIRHTLPLQTSIVDNGISYSWSTTLLEGLLDNPVPAPYTLGILGNDTLLTRAISKLSNLLLRSQQLRKLVAHNGGQSMCLICHYHNEMAQIRKQASDELTAQFGGRYKVIGVHTVIIEANGSQTLWHKLLDRATLPEQPRLEITVGPTNRLREIVLGTALSSTIPPIRIGDAVFTFRAM